MVIIRSEVKYNEKSIQNKDTATAL